MSKSNRSSAPSLQLGKRSALANDPWTPIDPTSSANSAKNGFIVNVQKLLIIQAPILAQNARLLEEVTKLDGDFRWID